MTPERKNIPPKTFITGLIRVVLREAWSPLYVLWLRLRVAVWGTWALEQAVFQCPPWLTLKILAAYKVKIGPEFDFHGRLSLHGTYHMEGKLTIGARCHIGPGVTLDLSRPIVIEDCCTIALNAQLLTHQDVGYSPLVNVYPTQWAGLTIEYGAFIGAGSTIMSGVRIGRCAVVGAGAVVREDVPAYTVVAGIPAKVIKQIDPQSLRDAHAHP